MSYCVKKYKVDFRGRILESEMVLEGLHTMERAQKCAQRLNAKEEKNIFSEHNYIFKAEEEL